MTKPINKITPAAIRGRYVGMGGGIVQRLEVRPDMCTNTITSVQKDNVLIIGELPSCYTQLRSQSVGNEE